jgi:hypothetical protein
MLKTFTFHHTPHKLSRNYQGRQDQNTQNSSGKNNQIKAT